MQACASRSTRGTADLWNRLKDVVSHMVDRLNEPESRFHASLVTNVLDLVNLLPKLNVSDDHELNRFAAEIGNKLCGFTARDLKTNDVLRVATAHDAAALLYEMDAVLREREQNAASETDSLGRPHLLAHVGLHGGCFAMNPTLSSVVRIQKARTALLLDHPFFGTLLFRLGARACSSIATMATDGVSLYFNPEFVETLSSAELIGTLAHEVMHPALQHHTRRAGRSPKRWNMACDYAINPMLLDAGLTLPKDVLYEARFVE